MIRPDILGSDVAARTGWNETTMLLLFERFIEEKGLEEELVTFLMNVAYEELKDK